MRLIEDEHEIRLTVEEWVNKSSGRGSFELIDATDGDDIVLASWSGLAPGWDYGDLIAYLVPWADVDIDDEFYEDFDRARFDLECGTWDHEDDRYYHFRDYNEWRDELPRLRPYESAGSGEVDQYRLMLDLNDVGKSWLTLLKFAESEGTALK